MIAAMITLGPTWGGVVVPAAETTVRARVALSVALRLAVLVVSLPVASHAAPFIWDQDDDHIDDRIETVHLGGYSFAFEQGDTLLPKRIDVAPLLSGLVYGIYVDYAQTPTTTDLAALTALGAPVIHRFEEIPAVRSVATFAQVQAIAALPGVERVEAVPLLYPMMREAAGTIAARDATQHVFPDWSGTGGAQGQGVVVAILDTGINDAPDGNY